MANPWYAFYPGDYGRKTAHLSMIEDSAYRRLLDHYYSTRRPIPTHLEQLFRICRAFAPEEQRAVRAVLGEFFTEHADGWHNSRVDREIEKAREIREKRCKAGRLSAQKRNTARTTHEAPCVEQVFTQPQSQAQVPSPPSAEGFSLLENQNLSSSNTRARASRGYTDEDFLERDLRKIAEARQEIEATTLKAQPWLTEDDIAALICERKGLTPKRYHSVMEIQRKWLVGERTSA